MDLPVVLNEMLHRLGQSHRRELVISVCISVYVYTCLYVRGFVFMCVLWYEILKIIILKNLEKSKSLAGV